MLLLYVDCVGRQGSRIILALSAVFSVRTANISLRQQSFIKDHAIARINLYSSVIIIYSNVSVLAVAPMSQNQVKRCDKNIPYCIFYSFVNNIVNALFIIAVVPVRPPKTVRLQLNSSTAPYMDFLPSGKDVPMPHKTDPTLFIGSPFSEAPLHSEDFYQALTNAISVGLVAINNSGMIILANRIARESINISSGIHLNDVLPELWHKISQTLRESKPRIEISVRGGESNYLVRISPIMLDTERVGVACVFTESTELEEIAMQMRFFQELTSELDTIINSSSDGLWICDAAANVLRINPSSERINKIRAEEVVGHNMRRSGGAGIYRPLRHPGGHQDRGSGEHAAATCGPQTDHDRHPGLQCGWRADPGRGKRTGRH